MQYAAKYITDDDKVDPADKDEVLKLLHKMCEDSGIGENYDILISYINAYDTIKRDDIQHGSIKRRGRSSVKEAGPGNSSINIKQLKSNLTRWYNNSNFKSFNKWLEDNEHSSEQREELLHELQRSSNKDGYNYYHIFNELNEGRGRPIVRKSNR
jgi:hypothetical protein